MNDVPKSGESVQSGGYEVVIDLCGRRIHQAVRQEVTSWRDRVLHGDYTAHFEPLGNPARVFGLLVSQKPKLVPDSVFIVFSS